MRGIILKDDARYDYIENYLLKGGHTFCDAATPPQELNFIIFPFAKRIDSDTYNDSFFSRLKKGTLIFSGINSDYLANKCTEHKLTYHAIIENPVVAAKNAVPTSEGVLAYLITNSIKTISGSRFLVIGYGICGSDLAKRLKVLGADVNALVRNTEKESAAYADCIKPIYIDALFTEPPFDAIINTVPHPILTNEMLDKTAGILMLDIASKPYGFNMEYAKKLNKKSALLAAIPGKYAVQTAGEILGDYIDNILCGRLFK